MCTKGKIGPHQGPAWQRAAKATGVLLPIWRHAARPSFSSTAVTAALSSSRAHVGVPNPDRRWVPAAVRSDWKLRPFVVLGVLLAGFSLEWLGGADSSDLSRMHRERVSATPVSIEVVVDRII